MTDQKPTSPEPFRVELPCDPLLASLLEPLPQLGETLGEYQGRVEEPPGKDRSVKPK